MNRVTELADRREQSEFTERDYKVWYNKGWHSSANNASIERAENNVFQQVGMWSPKADAWMDGWLDQAHGLRGKWHMLKCSVGRHHNGPDGCGEA